jgi:uncharacterized protein (TIGR02099 family)
MKRLLRATEVLAWAGFFALAALVLAVRFWVLPDIERYRQDIVAAMSRGLGLPVRVGAIQARWFGLRPHIALSDVRIYDAQGREALVLPSIENVVAWRSLARGQLVLHSVVIESPRLSMRRDPAGDLYIAGLKISGDGGSGGFGAWLLAQEEILIRGAEIEWLDELRGAPPLALSRLEIRLVNGRGTHLLGLKANTPADLGSTIDVRARLQGKDLDPAAFSGRVFLDIGHTDLAVWRAWVDYPLNVREGQGALRVWATVEAGRLAALTADVALAGLHMSLADELSPLELASVQGRVQGRALPDGVELSGRGLTLVIENGPEVPKTDFRIVWRPQAGGAVAASAIELDALRHVAGSLPLPPQLSEAIKDFAPRGRLEEARLEWSGPFDAPAKVGLRMRFADLGLRATGAVPGFSGLSGSVEATDQRGSLALASRKAALELPRIFPDPNIPFDSLAGQIEWERGRDGGVAVRIASITFANEHASGNVYGTYARHGAGPGTIDLSGVLNRADGRQVGRYLPTILPEAPRKWLTRGILAGAASDVRVRIRGDLRDFPFVDPAKGQFQVTARVERAVLDYAEGWPRIDNIVGDLNFERDRFEIVGRSGSILGAQLSNVRVAIPSLRGPERNVHVSGQADGPSADFLRFVQSSPLRSSMGERIADIRADGRAKLRLKVDIPLAELPKTQVTGEIDFAGNEVTVVPWLPPIESASGRVTFTDSGFTLHDARGRLLGGAVAVSGGTRAGGEVEILARGDASFEATRALFDHPLRKHLSGSFGYLVTVREQDGGERISFESPLRGLEIALPAPLAKRAADALPLRVEVNPAARGERDRVSISLGTLAQAELQRRRQGDAMVVQRTAVWIGSERDQPIRLPERPGTLVYGSLPSFDLNRWLPLLTGEAGEDSHPDSQAASPPIALELKFGVLDAFGRRLTKVALRASAEAAGWSANVSADELAGNVSYRARPQPRVIARLDRFTIPDDTPAHPSSGPPRPATRPSDLPALDLVAEEFTFRSKRLGRVELVASRAGEDWRIERANISNPDASVTGSGIWYAAPSRTAIQFELDAGDAGGFLARVGQPDTVKGGRARMQGSLAWQGDPATLDFPTLSGHVQMDAEDGQFLEIEPGLGKLIGLISLQALPRRISLDFRDVFSKGFQFDRIASSARIDSGALKLKEFRMRGSAAEVEMTGEVNLAHETQDLRVRVLPSLTDSAALGIGIVNPVAGVAAAIAQRILKNPLGQIFAYDYLVTGTWSDPKVERILPPPTDPVSN